MALKIIPDLIQSFKNINQTHRNFTCFVSEDIFPYCQLETSAIYNTSQLLAFNPEQISKSLALESNDILLIINDKTFPAIYQTNPFDKTISASSRLIEIPLFSTAPNLQEIKHYIDSMYATSPQDFNKKVDNFFMQLERSKTISFTNSLYDTHLFYSCKNSERWLEVGGFTELGTKQVYPCGEIEVSPLPFDQSVNINNQNTLNLNGEIIISGPTIVNAGYLPFTRASQNNIFNHLTTINHDNPIKLTIKNGRITQLDAVNKNSSNPGLKMLEQLFQVEERYTIVHELGISFNDKLEYLPGNHFYNELIDYSNDHNGSLHLGLGLLTITQYHFDLFALNTDIII